MGYSRKQRAYEAAAVRRWNVKTGATRSGKTYLDVAYMIPRRLVECPRGEGLVMMLGNTPETLMRNVVEPMRDLYADADLIGDPRADGTVRMFGHKVYLLGADTRDRVKALQGTSIAYCYGDEVTTWHPAVFDMLKSRLDRPHSVFDGTCNPAGPGHWFRRFLDSGADVFEQAYTIDDNPYLPEKFVRELKAEYAGTVHYDRFILGKWVKAEGLVYRSFDRGRHVVRQADCGMRQVVFGADIGHSNATAFVALGEGDDGRRYVLDEYYHSGRAEHAAKSPLAYARDFAAFRERVCGAYPGARYGGVFVDPSAAGFIAQLRELGEYSVYRARNDVLPGIAAVASAIDGDGVRILARCGHVLEEMAGYVWDERAARAGEDRPVKEGDHCMDAVRYGFAGMRVGRKGRADGGTASGRP